MRGCRASPARRDAQLDGSPCFGWTPPAVDGFHPFAPDLNVEVAAGFWPEAFRELARLEGTSFRFRGRPASRRTPR